MALLQIVIFLAIIYAIWWLYQTYAESILNENAINRVAQGSEFVMLSVVVGGIASAVGKFAGWDWLNILRTICDACQVAGICT